MDKTIVLIGMTGVGKSTLGKMLAQQLNLEFIDMDDVIVKLGLPIQEIIDNKGEDSFLAIEETAGLLLNIKGKVIAPGGSIVYSKKVMQTWKKKRAICVFLNNNIDTIRRRIGNIQKRGMVWGNTHSFEALYQQRLALYKRYADIPINCYRKRQKTILLEIINQIISYDMPT